MAKKSPVKVFAIVSVIVGAVIVVYKNLDKIKALFTKK
jgi:hypothetical protein